MIEAPFLQAGDCIGIVSSARKIDLPDLQKALHWIEEKGWTYKLGQYLDQAHHQFAGNDIDRASDLQRMIDDPSIKAIWFARGGYGSVRIAPLVNWENLKSHPKWLIGYSDVTVIHSALHRVGMKSIHATMPIDINRVSKKGLDTLKSFLIGKKESLSWPSTQPNSKGECSGRLIGGNLSVLFSLRGTEIETTYDNRILFIEDLDEYLYHIDRMLMNFELGNVFSRISGLIVGSMTDMNDHDIPFGWTAEESILRICNIYNIPLAFNCPAGHLDDNRALMLGHEVKLSVGDANVRLDYL